MNHKFTFPWVLFRGRNEETEIEVDVTYGITPGCPASLYGDYPHPAEGPEISILSVQSNGVEIETTADEDDRLYEAAEDRTDLEEWYQEQAEYRADMIRDERVCRD